MSTELQTLNERIADRIGKDLVDLIPKDQWQAMVDKEINIFKLDKAPKIIQDVLRDFYLELAKDSVSKLISNPKWKEDSNSYVDEELEKFIGRSAGNLVGAMLAPSMQIVMENLRRQLGYN